MDPSWTYIRIELDIAVTDAALARLLVNRQADPNRQLEAINRGFHQQDIEVDGIVKAKKVGESEY